MSDSTKLNALMKSLAQDPGFRRAYEENPRATLEQFGLDAAHCELILGQDWEGLKRLMSEANAADAAIIHGFAPDAAIIRGYAPDAAIIHGFASSEAAIIHGYAPDAAIIRGYTPDAAIIHGFAPQDAKAEAAPDAAIIHGFAPDAAIIHGFAPEAAIIHGAKPRYTAATKTHTTHRRDTRHS